MLPLVVGIVWLGLYPGAGAPAHGAGARRYVEATQPRPHQ